MHDIILNHIHERCLTILLNGGCWNQRHPLQRIHQQPRVDKLVGEERITLIVEDGSCFDCFRRGVNLVVERQQLPAGDLCLRCAIKSIDAELSLLAQLSFNWAETVFRYGEDYGDGRQLRDDGQSCGSRRLHRVARIHQPQTDAACDGSGDVAVVNLNLVELHRPLVVLYCALVLQHKLFFVIHDLLCNRVASQCGAIAFQVHLCLGEQIFVSLQRPLRLQKRCAVGARVDVNQWIALAHQLTFLKVHSDDQAIHLAGDRSGIDGSDRADCVEVNADVTLLSGRGCDRDLWRRGRYFVRGNEVTPYQHDYKRNDEHQQNPYDDPHYFTAVSFRTVGRELMVAVDVGLLTGVNGQSESPFRSE